MGDLKKLDPKNVIEAADAELKRFDDNVLGNISGRNALKEAEKKLAGFKPPNFSSIGLNADVSKEGVKLTRTPELDRQLEGLRAGFQQQNRDLRGLLPGVRAGFGKLTEAADATFAAERERQSGERSRAIGDLKQDLARRRVLGSSFASDTVGRREAEFAKQERALAGDEAGAKAQAFLQELTQTKEILSQANDATVKEFASMITQMNFESGLAADLQANLSAVLNGNLQQQAAILSKRADNAAAITGTVIGTAATVATGGKKPSG